MSEDIKNNIKNDIDNEKFILHVFEKDLTNEESKKYITLLSAISLAKRLRNTHAHEKESNANIDLVEENGIKYLKYKNTKQDSIIDCKIPVSYVNEFGKSITPLEEHIEFKRESIYYVNNMYNELSIKTGYYKSNNIDFNAMSKILGTEENIFNLPSYIFEAPIMRIKNIWELSGKNIINFSRIPQSMFECKEEVYKKILDMLDIHQLQEKEINRIASLPENLFNREGTIDELYKIAKLDINNLSKLPENIFYSEGTTIKELYKIFESDLSSLSKLPYQAFFCHQKDINELWKLVGENLEKFLKLPENAFKCDYKKFAVLLKIMDGDFEKLSQLPDITFKYDIDTINKLWESTGKNDQKFIELLKSKSNIKIESAAQFKKILPFYKKHILLLIDDEKIEEIKKLLNIDYIELLKLQYNVFVCNIDRLKFFWNLVEHNLDKFLKLPDDVFEGYCSSFHKL